MTREQLLNLQIDNVPSERYYELKRVIDNLPKPVDALGKFEDLIGRIACSQHADRPDISNKALIIMCADNGIIEEGVTDIGGYMTGVVTKKLATEEAMVNYMATTSNIKVLPVDIGVNGDLDCEGVIDKKVCKGTKNFIKEPAMTEEQVLTAIETGIELVRNLKDEGTGIICTGDMGIGNTTTAVAVICAILEGDPTCLTGRGTGLSDAGYNKKIDVIFEGLRLYGYDRDDLKLGSYDGYADPDRAANESSRIIDMVMNLGGLDIAGLVGVFIGGALYHVPIVVDGIISAAAALAADCIIPGCKQYMIGSHFGKEPATEIVFTELELDPIITADMSIGEGIGAVMLMPMLDMIMNAFNSLASFEIEE